MSHERRPDSDPKPIDTEGLIGYAEQCFGARVDIANFKYPSVSLLKDLEPLATRFPNSYMEDAWLIDDNTLAQSIVALVVESNNQAYAVIKIDGKTIDTLNSVDQEYAIASITKEQQTGNIVDADSLESPRIVNGALYVRPTDNFSQSVVFTNPKPNSQTDLKSQYHILGRQRTDKSKTFKDSRQSFLIGGTNDIEVIEVGAPSLEMATKYANILQNYGLWIDIK